MTSKPHLFRILFVLFLFTAIASVLPCPAQNSPQWKVGYPSREGAIDIRKGFAHPPKGYGNVPFFWWSGDSLRIDRLAEELDILADSPTEGFAISYNHTHAKVDSALNANGYGFCGVADYGKPEAFSEDWWEIWNEFSGMCADRGLGVGMDDYVFGWPGNHDFRDRLTSMGIFKDYQGRLATRRLARKDYPSQLNIQAPGTMLAAVAVPGDSVFVVFTEASPELHPMLGEKMVETYFEPFVEHMDERGRRGMNYFFQDELFYDIGLHSWCEDMPQEFMKRKGYDIVPKLPLLFIDGDGSTAVRLDYAEVVTQLAEERFFKPIYDWSASRGLIYGCDNMGRGLNPSEYMDYFRAISWFTAPGNDAPARGSSFIQTKVSSSVSHMYNRPRTWLEAFHSMGWDANGAVLTHQLDHHIIAGGNLLCLHGLYYSTHGGWWEWAPPCFHFRMPYWPHTKLWLEYAQRMCFVLSQGHHVCDIAILYPTETMQAIPGSKPDSCFALARRLSESGLDYDFIDYQSLRNAEMVDGRLSVSGESYRVLVLADAMAMHEETVDAIEAFKAAGGIVVSTGALSGQLCSNGIHRLESDEVVAFVNRSITPDFRPGSGKGRVLHHRVADQDVYMVMDVVPGDSLFFRCKGKVERWDAMSGQIAEIDVLKTSDEGTWVRFDGDEGSSRLIVFSPGEPRLASADEVEPELVSSTNLDGLWDIRIIPTMNNKWGDFRLPASNEMIGPEARSMRCAFVSDDERLTVNQADAALEHSSTEMVYGHGPYMMTANVPSAQDIDAVVASEGASASWKPYCWSWQTGVFDSPGSQGWHGLKGKVDSRFLILDKGAHQLFKTRVYVPESGRYQIVCEGVAPYSLLLDGKAARSGKVRLGKGWHSLFVAYKATPNVRYDVRNLRSSTVDKRQRSMVMLYKVGTQLPQERGAYAPIVASKWFGTRFLAFDPQGGESGQWILDFETAPGTVSFDFESGTCVSALWVDGKPVEAVANGLLWKVDLPKPRAGIPNALNFSLLRKSPTLSPTVVWYLFR